MKQTNYLPDWLNDESMKNAKNDTISVNEEQFWLDLIKKYLTPLDRNEAEEVKNNFCLILTFSTYFFSEKNERRTHLTA